MITSRHGVAKLGGDKREKEENVDVRQGVCYDMYIKLYRTRWIGGALC